MKRFIILSIAILSVVFSSTGQMSTYEHLIMYGQSLSTGYQSYPALSTESINGNFMIGDEVWINHGNTVFNAFKPLKAGTCKNDLAQPKTRASKASAECPIVATANHVQLQTGGRYKFLATSAGWPGKTIEQLSKEVQPATRYNDFIKTIDYGWNVKPNYIHCPAIFWMQGEYNYTGEGVGFTAGSTPTADKNVYKTLLLQLKDNMQADIVSKYKQSDKPLFISYQVGAQYTRGKELGIGMAQLEASNEKNDIVCAGPVYHMTDRGGHLDPNGYRWFGEMLGKVYYKTVVQGEDFKPLQPKEIYRQPDGKTLKIVFHVPVPPLVLDELTVEPISDYGFEIYNNDVRQVLTDFWIEGNSVYITCESALNGATEIVYAGLRTLNTRGHGNLRDSDTYSAHFNYQDLDKKVNGVYVYERDAAETKLRPSYEPRDASGVIYDKPYPLYNFSVAFYYRLAAGQPSYAIPNMATDISDISVRENTIRVTGHTLEVKADFDEKIQIYTLTGQLIYNVKSAGEWTQINHLRNGIFIVKLANKTFRVNLT